VARVRITSYLLYYTLTHPRPCPGPCQSVKIKQQCPIFYPMSMMAVSSCNVSYLAKSHSLSSFACFPTATLLKNDNNDNGNGRHCFQASSLLQRVTLCKNLGSFDTRFELGLLFDGIELGDAVGSHDVGGLLVDSVELNMLVYEGTILENAGLLNI
jgi:hypothetical protein